MTAAVIQQSATRVDLPSNENDDPDFIALIGAFVSHYAPLLSSYRVRLIHVDNWFGERWLGFAGKYKGIAAIRQRRGELAVDSRQRSLANPPFPPSRIQAYAGIELHEDGSTSEFEPHPLHVKKHSGLAGRLFSNGLCAWYSGNTKNNSNGSLMVYELCPSGQNAWYLSFQQNDTRRWDVVSCRNTQITECRRISANHYAELDNH